MRPGEKEILPMWLRTTIVVALLLTLYYGFTHRLVDGAGHSGVAVSEHGNEVASIDLFFVDRGQGVISVLNAADNEQIKLISAGEDGFMRSVMRGFARERKANNMGPEVPFTLTVWEDGLVSLIDPQTERRVELSAFGKDNVEAFTQLLANADAGDNAPVLSNS